MSISRVGIVGGGQMGAGIAEVCAKAGVDVIVVEADEALSLASQERIERSLTRAVERGKLTDDDRDDVTLLRRMVEAGYLGRKTGRGFYEY